MVTTPTGSLTAPEVARLEGAIKDSLRRAGHKVVKSTVGFEDSAAMLGCEAAEPDCVARIAALADATIVAVPRAETAGARLMVKLRVFRGADGASLGTADVRVGGPGERADYAKAIRPAIGRAAVEPARAEVTASANRAAGAPGRILPLTWAAAGGSAALLGLGTYFGIRMALLHDELESIPLDTYEGRLEASDVARRGDRAAAAAAIFVTAGSVAATAALFLVADNLWLGLVFRGGESPRAGASLTARF